METLLARLALEGSLFAVQASVHVQIVLVDEQLVAERTLVFGLNARTHLMRSHVTCQVTRLREALAALLALERLLIFVRALVNQQVAFLRERATTVGDITGPSDEFFFRCPSQQTVRQWM